jgi:hypothetical protein
MRHPLRSQPSHRFGEDTADPQPQLHVLVFYFNLNQKLIDPPIINIEVESSIVS